MKNFNYTYKALLIALATLCTTAVLAAPATIPNTFSSGTAAVAAEVNANFTALKSAIDDNDSRINAPSGGFASVAAHAFQQEESNTTCSWITGDGFSLGFYRSGSDLNCDAVAGIQLPHNATLQSLTCTALDNTATQELFFRLYRVNFLTPGNVELIYKTATTVNGALAQVVNDTTVSSVGRDIIDNQLYAYYIAATYSSGTDASSNNLGVYGCTVAY